MTDLDAAIRARLNEFDASMTATGGLWGAEEMRAAIVAVLDLHKPRTAVEGPLEGKPICDECSDGTNEWLATADPCPTKRAIAEKLGVEVADA